MKLINCHGLRKLILLFATRAKVPTNENENVNVGWLPFWWLPYGWLPFWWLPVGLAAFGMLCVCSAWCLDMLAILYVAVRGQLINNN